MPFPLTTEDWIPCRTRDGREVELGFRDLFAQAHDLDRVQDRSPLVTLALHRLLLAILHRVYGPPDLDSWKRLHARGRFEMEPMLSYLEAQRERLDLLHPVRPFYQVRGLAERYEPDGIGRLLPDRSNYGVAVNLFEHRPQERAAQEVLTLSEAARALVGLQGYAPGGLVRKKGEPTSATAAPLSRGAFVLIRGNSLFETLLFNLLVYDPEDAEPVAGDPAQDLPAWEQPAPDRPRGKREPSRRPYGWVDWLTWQSRRLELALDPSGRAVRGVVYCVGCGLDRDGLTDPMLAYRMREKRGLLATGFSEERAVWRDCHAFLRFADADGSRAPRTILQLARFELRQVLGASRTVPLDVLGMLGDKAKIKMTRHEELAIPAPVLADPERIDRIRRATELTEGAGAAVGAAVAAAARAVLAPGERTPEKGDVTALVRSLGAAQSYWARMAAPFSLFLGDLRLVDSEARLDELWAAAVDCARSCVREAAAGMGTGARQLQGAAVADARLERDLRTYGVGEELGT